MFNVLNYLKIETSIYDDDTLIESDNSISLNGLPNTTSISSIIGYLNPCKYSFLNNINSTAGFYHSILMNSLTAPNVDDVDIEMDIVTEFGNYQC